MPIASPYFEKATDKDVTMDSVMLNGGTLIDVDSGDNHRSKSKNSGQTTEQRRKKVTAISKNAVMFARLHRLCGEGELSRFLVEFGKVKRVRISRNPKTWKSRGYGFAEFRDAEVAAVAAEALNGYILMGKPIVARNLSEDELSKRPGLFFTFGKRGMTYHKLKIDKYREEVRELFPKPIKEIVHPIIDDTSTEELKYREQIRKLISSENQRALELEEKLASMGIPYNVPRVTDDRIAIICGNINV